MTPEALKEWREKHGYSQSQLAEALGIKVLTISRWERGVIETPPYLHITLKCLKKKGEGIKTGRPKKTGKEGKKHGKRDL